MVLQWLISHTSNAEKVDSVPDQRTKILDAV